MFRTQSSALSNSKFFHVARLVSKIKVSKLVRRIGVCPRYNFDDIKLCWEHRFLPVPGFGPRVPQPNGHRIHPASHLPENGGGCGTIWSLPQFLFKLHVPSSSSGPDGPSLSSGWLEACLASKLRFLQRELPSAQMRSSASWLRSSATCLRSSAAAPSAAQAFSGFVAFFGDLCFFGILVAFFCNLVAHFCNLDLGPWAQIPYEFILIWGLGPKFHMNS